MALAFVASTSGREGGSTTPYVLSFPAGACDLIVVSAMIFNNSDTFGTPTFNGNNMTAIPGATGNANSWYVKSWYIIGNSGTHDISIPFTSADIVVSAVSYSGALQSASVIQASHYQEINTGATSGASTVTTTAVANCWAIAFAFTEGEVPTGYTVGTRRTTGNFYQAADSNGTITSSSTYTATWSSSGATRWFLPVIEVAPAVASGPTGVKTWNGVTQSTGIKTYQGVDLANVKSVNGIT